jgi:hypothetical protein
MELLLGDEEVWSGQTRITAQKGHNFWSDRWIALKYFLEFLEAVFLGVGVESLLSDK